MSTTWTMWRTMTLQIVNEPPTYHSNQQNTQDHLGSLRLPESSQNLILIGYFFVLSVFWAKFMWTYAWTHTIHDEPGTIDTSIVLKYPNPTCMEHQYSLNKAGQISHMIWLRNGQNNVFFIKGGVLNAILKFVGIKF